MQRLHSTMVSSIMVIMMAVGFLLVLPDNQGNNYLSSFWPGVENVPVEAQVVFVTVLIGAIFVMGWISLVLVAVARPKGDGK